MSRKQFAALAAILAVGALLRGAYLAEIRTAPDFRAPRLDATYHDYWARGLAFGQWAPPADEADPRVRQLPYFRPPGYPFFLALVYKLTGGGWIASRAVQFALGLLSAALGFWFVRRWWGPAAGLVTAGLSATYWALVYYEGEYLEPALLVALTWGLFIALGEWRARPRAGVALLAGALAGAFALVRPNVLLFVPVAASWMIAAGGGGWRAAVRRGALPFCAAAALTVLPVTARNWVVARDLVLISSNGGVNLLMGQDEAAITGHASDTTGHWNCFDYPRLMEEASARAGRPLKASEISAGYAREAVALMLAQPLRTLRLLGYKALLFWGPREVSNNKVEELERRASRTLRSLPVGFSLLAAAGLVGFLLDRRRWRGADDPEGDAARASVGLLLGLFALTYCLSFLPYVAAGQYRMPVVPVLAAFAGVAAARIARLARRSRREAAAWLGALLAAWALLSVNVAGYEVNPTLWHLGRASAAAASGDAALAEREYLEAIALTPGWDTLHFSLGVLYARGQRLEEAAGEFRRAVELNPAHAKATYNLGLALFWLGRVAESVPHFERAVHLKPDYAEARQRLAAARALVSRPGNSPPGAGSTGEGPAKRPGEEGR